MKLKSKKSNNNFINKLLNNKIVLYIVAFIALLDVIAYIINKEFGAVIFFYLVCLISYKFSNNMTVVLGSALIATSLVHLLKYMFGFKENFIAETTDDKEEMVENKQSSSTLSTTSPVTPSSTPPSRTPPSTTQPTSQPKSQPTSTTSTSTTSTSRPQTPPTPQTPQTTQSQTNVETLQNNKKSAFTNKKLNPAVINNIPNKDKLTQNMSKADNIEAAYDNLEKTIGENGIKSMSGATKDLIAQQNQLVKGLKEVTPVLNEAMGALSKIDLSSLSGMFNKFSSNI